MCLMCLPRRPPRLVGEAIHSPERRRSRCWKHPPRLTLTMEGKSMPKATQHDTPPRRTFLGYLIGATAGTSIVYGCTDLGVAGDLDNASNNPDAELIALCDA